MIKPVLKILFATDLSENCQQALEFTIAQGTRFNAVIYMLHVIKRLPEHYEGQLKGLLGRHQWDDIAQAKEAHVKKSLLGKKATNVVVRKKVQKFCQLAGMDESSCDFQSREIIISDGDVVGDILAKAEENDCDLIIMGARKSYLSGNSIGSTINAVLKGTKVPVTIVPAEDKKESESEV